MPLEKSIGKIAQTDNFLSLYVVFDSYVSVIKKKNLTNKHSVYKPDDSKDSELSDFI